MGMFDSAKEGALNGILEKLMESEAVQQGLQIGIQVRDTLIKTANRFDQRFGDAQTLGVSTGGAVARIEAKLDRVIFLLEHPVDQSPAGEHKLELMERPKICSVEGCKNSAIHDHGDGIPVFADLSTTIVGNFPIPRIVEVPHESEQDSPIY